ncbi:hypothetical protein BGZ60DRAFT_387004 [Tricladium varicosporioides]|nr:hypothetical protein BGZ60DRAFT_387004 [Hymenoscyphus varicosporioides]
MSHISPSDKIAIIGAGLSGVGMGVQLKRLLNHENFEIYDKLDDIGGTWAQNKYPNLSCDVPSEYYSFSFFQNPNWSTTYGTQQEILDYIHDCARHFDLGSHIKLQQECISIQWSEEETLWTLAFRSIAHDMLYEVKARYVVTAMGILNVPNGLDDLPILKDFTGQCFHTADWRDIDFAAKRVMVIGNGCSANQVIPWILNEEKPKSLVQIVRSAQWVAPKSNPAVSGLMKWCLRYIPFVMQLRRLWTAWTLDQSFAAFYNNEAGSKARKSAESGIRAYMESVCNPKYRDILIPKYDFGAKRAVMDHGYLASTNSEKFTLIQCDGLQSVGKDGRTLVDQAGNSHQVDIVIIANGFKTQDLLTPMKVIGKNGKDLRELWEHRGGSEAYMGVSVNGFPNFFMLAGPNTLPSANSTLQGIECSIVYITRLLSGFWSRIGNKKSGNAYIMPTVEAETRFNGEIQKGIKGLIYTNQVNTWYINKNTGKNTLVYPGTQMSFWWSRCMRGIQWGDWFIKRS